MQPPQILEREALDTALRAGFFLLFKHSFRCHVSARAFAEYQEFAAGRDDLPTGWIDAVAQRPLSLWVAGETGVTNASPQVLLLCDGRVVWSASHHDITHEALARAMA